MRLPVRALGFGLLATGLLATAALLLLAALILALVPVVGVVGALALPGLAAALAGLGLLLAARRPPPSKPPPPRLEAVLAELFVLAIARYAERRLRRPPARSERP
ncbi:MAG: hypothetical protein ACLFTG_16180 [Alphaproteobacteria bacterium]